MKNKGISCFKILKLVLILLINVKMPTIVAILKFMSRINFILSSIEHEISFITSEPDLAVSKLFAMVINRGQVSQHNLFCISALS